MEHFRKLAIAEKTLKINLDLSIYGSFAEIGAGQEVAANFFRAGASSGTIAKTISAYDMTFSDHIYGKTDRYVCEERLHQMLEREYMLLEKRLGSRREKTKFFAFASTLETLNFNKTNQGHGWLGFRYQNHPMVEPSECVIHVILKDSQTDLQRQAIGIIGVNLIYACLYEYHKATKIVDSLTDKLSEERIEVDMFQVSGTAFKGVDNRLLSLRLVKNELTQATMFNPQGKILQPSEALYKKNVMILRGRFRPLTLVNMDMFESGLKSFIKDRDVKANNVFEIAELTLNDLSLDGEIDERDFLDRVEILRSMGKTVMISNYHEYYKLVPFISKYTRGMKIGIVLGILNLQQIFNERFYNNLDGGILESLGKLFGRNIKMFVYPSLELNSNKIYCSKNFKPSNHLTHLLKYLINTNKITDLENLNIDNLNIISDQVLALIREGNRDWTKMVPDKVAKIISSKNLLGYRNYL